MQGSPSHLTSPLYLQGDPHLVGIVTKNCPHTLFYTKIAFFSKKIKGFSAFYRFVILNFWYSPDRQYT